MHRSCSWAALGALLLLAACSKPGAGGGDSGAAEPSNPPPPASAPVLGAVDLSQDLDLNGTEPFWGLQIRTDVLKLSGPERPEVTVSNTGPQVTGKSAVWSGKSEDGKTLKVTLTDQPCSDGMSDRRYPLTARVEVADQVLKGCADTAKQMVQGQPASKP